MEDRQIRAVLDRHWAASDANEFEAEHQISVRTRCSNILNQGERIRRAAEDSVVSRRATEPETLHCAADDRRGRPLGQ